MTDGLKNFPSLSIKKSVTANKHSVIFNSEQGHKNTFCSVQQEWPWSKRVTVSHWPAPVHSCSIETALCKMKRKKSDNGTLELLDVNIFVEIKHEYLSSFVNFETGVLQSGNLGKIKCPFLVKWFMWNLWKGWIQIINMSWYRFIAS